MNRLLALDAAFLLSGDAGYADAHRQRHRIRTGEGSGRPVHCFCAHTRARLSLLPSYTRRLKKTPFDIDHPVWVKEEPELDWHLRHCALPEPGTTEQQPNELVAQLHSVPLDRNRPLWQYTLIEGLQDGGFAVYAKVHHAAMDGVAGLGTLGAIYDFAPDAPQVRPVKSYVPSDEAAPDARELTGSALADFVRQIGRAIAGAPTLAKTLTNIYPHLMRDVRAVLGYARGAPQTRLNRPIRRERVFAMSSVPLSRVKALAKETMTTINDVVLAVSAGALRRWLDEHGELPDQPLVRRPFPPRCAPATTGG